MSFVFIRVRRLDLTLFVTLDAKSTVLGLKEKISGMVPFEAKPDHQQLWFNGEVRLIDFILCFTNLMLFCGYRI